MRQLRGGRHGAKRKDGDPLGEVQAANRAWWDETPMAYDWRERSQLAPGSAAWFDRQDRLSDAQHAHFLGLAGPFELLLQDLSLEGMDVLEIGVGSGYHAELMSRRGARVTGIDLSASTTALARQRFAAKGLAGTLEEWDAEDDRADYQGRFDVIWSWGVIHHSAHTARIVRNASGWLKEGGVFAGMVYHRDSTRLPVALVRDWLIGRNWRSHSVDEALCRSTDGFSARFYPADQWRDLLLAFFDDAQTFVQGLDVDLVPLPQPARAMVWKRLSPAARRRLLGRIGHFLLFRADRPR